MRSTTICLALASMLAVLVSTVSRSGAAYDLVSLGSDDFNVDPGATTASYSQTYDALAFAGTVAMGDTLGGTFAEQNWSLYSEFALRMTLTGANPDLPFSIQFYDPSFEVINTYQGYTTALNPDSTGLASLVLSTPGTGNLSRIAGMQFTWDGGASMNLAISEVVSKDAQPEPAPGGSFVASAPGGARFMTATGQSDLVPRATNWVGTILPAAATSWSVTSDSNAKTGITVIDHQEVLRGVAALPVAAWQYTHEPTHRHIGPMAQDFREAFGLGFDNTHISTLDTDGVALSALKGLIEELKERQQRSAAQAKRLSELETQLLDLRDRIGDTLPPRP